MIKLGKIILVLFALSSTSYAEVNMQEIGDTTYREISRIIFRRESKACYVVVHGSEGAKISCVHLRSIPAGLPNNKKIGETAYRKLYTIIDSDLGVKCLAVIHGSSGVDLTCEADNM